LAAGRRQRLPRRLRRLAVGRRARPAQPRAEPDRVGDLPRRPALDLGRPVEIPPGRRLFALPPRRPDRPPEAAPARPGHLVRRTARSAAQGAGRRSASRAEGSGKPRFAGRRPRLQRRQHVRGCLQGAAGAPAPAAPGARGMTAMNTQRENSQAVTRMTMIQALRSAMDVMLERDDNVVVFGQDVGYFGGVFRCTEGLQNKYGTSRVFDAPISESGIIGAAVGMCAYGLRPVVEIQFADYVYPASD